MVRGGGRFRLVARMESLLRSSLWDEGQTGTLAHIRILAPPPRRRNPGRTSMALSSHPFWSVVDLGSPGLPFALRPSAQRSFTFLRCGGSLLRGHRDGRPMVLRRDHVRLSIYPERDGSGRLARGHSPSRPHRRQRGAAPCPRPLAETAAVQKPTRVRYIVLAFAATLSMITYLDRACLGSAWYRHHGGPRAPNESDLGVVFAAFALAYALCEVPSGWLGDVFGPRRVLIRIVVCWSVFTALTGLVGMSWNGFTLGLTGLAVVQFLLGMGEAGAYPNLTRALHNWFPFHRADSPRGRSGCRPG